MIYWPDWMDGFLDALLDIPQNIQECGVGCAYTDIMAHVLWLLNNQQTLDCSNTVITFLLGVCE